MCDSYNHLQQPTALCCAMKSPDVRYLGAKLCHQAVHTMPRFVRGQLSSEASVNDHPDLCAPIRQKVHSQWLHRMACSNQEMLTPLHIWFVCWMFIYSLLHHASACGTFLTKNSQEGLRWNRKHAGFHTGLWQSDRGFCYVWCQENVANLGERFIESVASCEQSPSKHESCLIAFLSLNWGQLQHSKRNSQCVTNSTNK